MIASSMLVPARQILSTVKTIDRSNAFIGHLYVHLAVDLEDVPSKFLTTWLAGCPLFLHFEM